MSVLKTGALTAFVLAVLFIAYAPHGGMPLGTG